MKLAKNVFRVIVGQQNLCVAINVFDEKSKSAWNAKGDDGKRF